MLVPAAPVPTYVLGANDQESPSCKLAENITGSGETRVGNCPILPEEQKQEAEKVVAASFPAHLHCTVFPSLEKKAPPPVTLQRSFEMQLPAVAFHMLFFLGYLNHNPPKAKAPAYTCKGAKPPAEDSCSPGPR
ncbi:hypothetical protein QYF61_017203 [Mycteria americana]|uniref:Uncharacterized protein n=1 Tax=Mycteria americana TaxID=33587 RepID=A0AAN7MI73_MYCAM|nr:hypothetical protein QYF61_017203 [Mycteria americana]